jgi:NADPH:quinone reductase-like Zn-dependent oxidoreductase
VLALEQAAEAHRRLEAGHRQGKLVLEVRPS